jgi:lysophospholipase L1-like esterase
MLVLGGLVVAGLLVLAVLAGVLLVYVQGRRQPSGDPQYVAMGSSFAAGIGLGPRAPGSPIACMRTINGYPSQLAALIKLPLVDVSCSGATTAHILNGGQFFQRPQLDAVKPGTKLVTITSGGNDVGYVGGLSSAAAQNGSSFSNRLARLFLRPPAPRGPGDFDKVRRDLAEVVAQVQQRAPAATVVLVTYPAILPPDGTCPRLNISEDQARQSHKIGNQLADATRLAAQDSGALLVDMHRLGADYHACADTPWTNGWKDVQGTPFHPTLLGARETARAIAAALTPPVPELKESKR